MAVALAGCRSSTNDRDAAPAAMPGSPVIVISIDTLRADHLPAYGYAGVATPAIDALRRDSILFQNAYSHVPLTLPSHASLFTGLLPPQHGVRSNIGYRLDGAAHPTLARLLKAKGLRHRRRRLGLRHAQGHRPRGRFRLVRGHARDAGGGGRGGGPGPAPGRRDRPPRARVGGGGAAPVLSCCSFTSTSRIFPTNRRSLSAAGTRWPTTARSRPPMPRSARCWTR